MRTAVRRLGAGRGVLATLLAIAAVAPGARADEAIPVRVGLAGMDYDACGTLAGVAAGEGGATTVPVLARPEAGAPVLDALGEGATAMVCEERGAFSGIVYSQEEGADCGVTSPRPEAPYTGPCQAGWIETERLVPLAG